MGNIFLTSGNRITSNQLIFPAQCRRQVEGFSPKAAAPMTEAAVAKAAITPANPRLGRHLCSGVLLLFWFFLAAIFAVIRSDCRWLGLGLRLGLGGHLPCLCPSLLVWAAAWPSGQDRQRP